MADEEEEIQQEEGQETEKQKKDKVSKKHAEIMKIVTAIVGGEANLKPKKVVKGDVTARIVAKLFSQEQIDLEIKASEGLRDLLKTYVAYQAEMSRLKKQADEIDIKKKKEFNEAATKWLQMINRQEVMTAEYTEALKAAFLSEDEEKKKS